MSKKSSKKDECKCGCGCGPDCTCGCQDGKECTCNDSCCCGDCDCDCCSVCVEVGDVVPEFELETWCPKTGEFGAISLKKLKKAGKWTVLVFFPAAFTGVCPTELADIAEQYKELSKLGAEVISVSEDTKYVLQAWAKTEPLLADVKFPMGSDPTGEIADLFGVYDVKTGLALRGTFIISPAGVLVSSEISFYNVARSAAELLRKLEANVYVAKNPGEVCPAKWVSGKKA